LSNFPVGFLTEFISIMSTTTSEELPVLSAHLPSALGLGQQELEVTVSSTSLAWLWNSTTGEFINESAPSSDTLYEITVVYWRILVYLSAFMYMLYRVFGSFLIPGFDPVGNKRRRNQHYENLKGYENRNLLRNQKRL